MDFLKNTQSLFVEYLVLWLSHSEKVTDLNDNGPLWCAPIELWFSTVPSTFIQGNSQRNCKFTLKMALFTTLRHIIFLKEVKGWIFFFGFSPKIVCFSWPIHPSPLSSPLYLILIFLECWFYLTFYLWFYFDHSALPLLSYYSVGTPWCFLFIFTFSKHFFKTNFIYICACICFALACSHEENVKIFFPLSSSMHSIELRILNSSIVFWELPIFFNLIQTFGFLSCKRQYK